jgi:uncharacterized protein DUF3862
MRRLLLALLLPALVLAYTGCQDKSKSSAGATAATAGRKTMSRADFEAAVKGKSQKEVLEALGEPDRRYQAASKEEWSWAAMTTNGAKTDVSAKAIFENGKVVDVAYVD